MSLSYSHVITARSGTSIPVFASGQAMFSKYSPERDAETFAALCRDSQRQFFLVCGLGSGIHIERLRKRFPAAKIIAVEGSAEDMKFLERSFAISRTAERLGVSVCLPQDVFRQVTSAYVPVLHGDFTMLQQRAWADNHAEEMKLVAGEVRRALEEIAADVATQARFGRQWHRNILQNLLLSPELKAPGGAIRSEAGQTALIAAAGPSLDQAVPLLKDAEFRAGHYVIATDTALPVLLKNGISPEMAVTIDGQLASRLHFTRRLPHGMTLAADMASLPSVVRRAREAGCPVLLFRNAHPLSALVSGFIKERTGEEPPAFSSGAGTVTITALDIAVRMGFRKICAAGADFSYRGGKAYAAGTYFDEMFGAHSGRTEPAEQGFASMLCRRPLVPGKNGARTTRILEAYRISLEDYLARNGVSRTDGGNGTLQEFSTGGGTNPDGIRPFTADRRTCSDFLEWYLRALEASDPRAVLSILPLAAWHTRENSGGTDIFSSLKLAYSQTVRYNGAHGK